MYRIAWCLRGAEMTIGHTEYQTDRPLLVLMLKMLNKASETRFYYIESKFIPIKEGCDDKRVC
jgi:hypothetical protein